MIGSNRFLYFKMPSAARHKVAANQLLSGESGQCAPASRQHGPVPGSSLSVGVQGVVAVGGAQKPWQEWVVRCCPILHCNDSAGWYPSQEWEQYSIVTLGLKQTPTLESVICVYYGLVVTEALCLQMPGNQLLIPQGLGAAVFSPPLGFVGLEKPETQEQQYRRDSGFQVWGPAFVLAPDPSCRETRAPGSGRHGCVAVRERCTDPSLNPS